MCAGYIKIHRALMDWEWYSDSDMVKLWIHLLLSANYADSKWRGIEIKRGQYVCSIRTLASELGFSLQHLRTLLARLKSTHEVTQSSTQLYTIITICKYDDYQSFESDEQHTQQHTQQHTTNTLSEEKERTKEKEDINNNKNKKENILSKDNIQKKDSLDFVSSSMQDVFELWLEYKRQRRESYKSELSLKRCYNHLMQLSGGNEQIADAIVNQSIANNWAGLFELKSINNGNSRQAIRKQEQLERANEALDILAELRATNVVG